MRSKPTIGPPIAIAVALLLTACAHRERSIVRLGPGEEVDLASLDMKNQSLIIELREGQVIPFDITIEGDLITSPPGASVPLTVKRTCFLRIDDRGLRISPDDQSFDERARVPGTFQFGVGVTKGEGTKAKLRVTTPVR